MWHLGKKKALAFAAQLDLRGVLLHQRSRQAQVRVFLCNGEKPQHWP